VAWCEPPVAACVKNSDIMVVTLPEGLGRSRPRSMAEFVTLRATGPGRGGADTAPAVASPHPETTQSACNLQGGRGDLASGAGANGDLGIVSRIDMEESELSVDFDGREVVYGFAELDELVLAYATTIHKSQGSEYPSVVIPLTTQHYPMQCN